MATINGFEDIPAWQDSRELCKLFFKAWKGHADFSRDFELLNQMKRSSGSIMDNIAEGYGRGGNKEFMYFMAISKGSSSEFRSQLYRAFDQEYISQQTFDNLYKRADSISAQLTRFMAYLNRSALKGSRYKVDEPEVHYGISDESELSDALNAFFSSNELNHGELKMENRK
jgi:four helix bundle protein